MISKEPLIKIWDFIETHYNEKDDYPKNLYDILEDVEQDLERLEQLEDNIKIHKETIKMQYNQIESLEEQNKGLKDIIEIYRKIDNKLFEIVEESLKLKKVIGILKIKRINERMLQESKDVHQYNHWISNLMNYPELTQEEYDLLKEIYF